MKREFLLAANCRGERFTEQPTNEKSALVSVRQRDRKHKLFPGNGCLKRSWLVKLFLPLKLISDSIILGNELIVQVITN